MKEINGKHYVDGGPVCPSCKVIKNLWGKGKKENEDYITAACNPCHGTGVLPVEDWPDAVKAEWLKSWLLHLLRIHVIYPEDSEDEWQWEIINTKTRESLAVNEDFSQALTAAVIAVAKEVAA